jgi:hypothetical protein
MAGYGACSAAAADTIGPVEIISPQTNRAAAHRLFIDHPKANPMTSAVSIRTASRSVNRAKPRP